MAKFNSRYQPQGVVFYRVSTRETPDTVRKFLEKESLQMPVLMDQSGQVERLFGVWIHPSTYIIDKQGLVRCRNMGPWDWENPQSSSLIDQMLQGR